MCHDYDARRWTRTDEADPEASETDPSFLEEEPAEDVELLTDGGGD